MKLETGDGQKQMHQHLRPGTLTVPYEVIRKFSMT